MKSVNLKKVLSLLLALAMVLSMAACGASEPAPAATEAPKAEAPAATEAPAAQPAEEPEEKVLVWNLGSAPSALDPMLMGTYNMQVVNNTFEGLMRMYNGKLIPGLAESYEISEDGKTYTFHLRDAKWSDGKPVTANDFIFAWIRMLNPELKMYYSTQMFYIKNARAYYNGECTAEELGLTAVDDKTLVVELEAPTAFFLDLTAFNIYYPVREDVADNEGAWSLNPDTYFCTGPFKLEEFKLNESLVLVKNENYWDAENVHLDKLVVTFIEDSNSCLTAYRAGDIDVFKSVPTQEIATLRASDPEFHVVPMLGVEYYVFNNAKAPLDKVEVRKALSLAIDRTALVDNVTKAGEMPCIGNVTHDILLSDGREFRDAAGDYGVDLTKASVEEAQALLAEAGYPNGEGFPELTLVYNTSDMKKAVAEAVQQMWKENLGITINLEGIENSVLGQRRKSGDFDIARWGWSADYPDPNTYLSVWTTDSSSNCAAFSNAEFDQCIADATNATGADRDALLLRAEEILIGENHAILPMYETVDTCLIRSNVVDWDKTGFNGWFFGFADIVG